MQNKLCNWAHTFNTVVVFYLFLKYTQGFPGGSDGKQSACNAGGPGSILGLGRSPGEGKGNSLQYSCLENSIDRGAWQSIVHEVTENWTQLSHYTFTLYI